MPPLHTDWKKKKKKFFVRLKKKKKYFVKTGSKGFFKGLEQVHMLSRELLEVFVSFFEFQKINY